MIRTTLITAATDTPLSQYLAALHLRHDDESAGPLIAQYISAAVSEFEHLTGIALLSSTWETVWDHWPQCGRRRLPKGLVTSITSVKYCPEGGAVTTMSASRYALDTSTSEIVFDDDYSFPSDELRDYMPIVVRFVAGWATPDAIPQDIIRALLVRVQLDYDRPLEHEAARMQRVFDACVANYRVNEW